MSKTAKEYEYFDTPDGEDTLKKLVVVSKTAGLITFGAATTDVLLYSYPKGYLQTLARYAYFFVPFMGMSSAFVIVTNMSANIRGKDDKFNWVLGALAAGGIFGAWRKSVLAGFTACSGFTATAILKKHAVQNGWSLLDVDVKQQQGGIRSIRHDFTLTDHRPGNWTTGK